MAKSTTTSSMAIDEPPPPAPALPEQKGCLALWPVAGSAAMTADKARLAFYHCCLLLVGMAGGSVLAWWAISFHPSNEQLWMVPVGLILLGTPIFVWLSVFASSACQSPAVPVSRSVELSVERMP